MVDRALTSRQNTAPHGPSSDERVLRERIAAHADALERAAAGIPSGATRRVVQVYNGGSIPTANPAFYLGHPAILYGPEKEGGTWTANVDTTSSVAFVALGSSAPVAGDYRIISAVGGRWVSGAAEQSGPGTPTCPSMPCNLPNGSMLLHFNGSADFFAIPASTAPLNGNCTTGWTTGCVGPIAFGTSSLIFDVSISGSVVTFRIRGWVGANTACSGAPDCTAEYATDGSVTTLSLGSVNCSTHTITFSPTYQCHPGVAYFNVNLQVTW